MDTIGDFHSVVKRLKRGLEVGELEVSSVIRGLLEMGYFIDQRRSHEKAEPYYRAAAEILDWGTLEQRVTILDAARAALAHGKRLLKLHRAAAASAALREATRGFSLAVQYGVSSQIVAEYAAANEALARAAEQSGSLQIAHKSLKQAYLLYDRLLLVTAEAERPKYLRKARRIAKHLALSSPNEALLH